MKSAICAFVLNEARHIQEWIAYHRALGFDSFLLYDNGSTDGTLAKIEQARSIADIRVIDWSHQTDKGAQNYAYTDCCARHKSEFDWIAFIDCDEYINSGRGLRIETLLAVHKNNSGIVLNWSMYGSSGHVDFPTGLLIDAFDRCADPSTFDVCRHTKMIVRPEHVIAYKNPHYFDLAGQAVRGSGLTVEWAAIGISKNIDLSGWRVNHYFTGSVAHWKAKMARGYRDRKRTGDEFELFDRNEVVDSSATLLSDQVRSLITAMHG